LNVKIFIQGFANEAGTMKKNCEMPLEGKKEFSFSEYTQLAQCSTRCIDRGMAFSYSDVGTNCA
jgi:hypothetical protein